MKKFLIILAVFSAVLQGCSDFKDVNTNPNEPVNINPSLLLNNILYSITTDDATTIGQGTYDMFVGGDMGACWAQHWAKNQYNNEERYIPRSGVVRTFWNTMYYRVLTNADNMQKLSVTNSNKNLQGVALVLKAYGFSLLTDVYGDIPFSEALKGDQGILLPKYDKQEDVYTGVLAMLDEAVTLLSPGNGDIPAANDFMYNGDVTKWKKFANSLKFRCLMRIVLKKPSVAPQLQALASENNMFTSNDDEAKYSYLVATPNPIHNTIIVNVRTEYRVAKSIIDAMPSDKRLEVYAEKTQDDGTYKGKPAGYLDPSTAGFTNKNTSAIGSFYTASTLPAYLMSYSELQFLLAEARFRGLITTSTDEEYVNNGVKASFLANGLTLSDANDFLTNRLTYSTQSNKLNVICTQKWIALYSQGIEAWLEQKRTHLPDLPVAIDGAIDEIPSRYKYPDNELSINKANYEAAVASQGPDLLTTKIWWMTY